MTIYIYSFPLSLSLPPSTQPTHPVPAVGSNHPPGCGRPVAVPWVLMPGRMVSVSPRRQTSPRYPHVSRVYHISLQTSKQQNKTISISTYLGSIVNNNHEEVCNRVLFTKDTINYITYIISYVLISVKSNAH